MVLRLLALAQLLLGVRVLRRLLRLPHRLKPASGVPVGRVAAVLPVLDEEARLPGCLRTLMGQSAPVTEILVVDGGSSDRTLAVARERASRDRRVRVLDASPVPAGWNGKAWGLESGARGAGASSAWLLTVDADTRLAPGAAAALLLAAEEEGLDALSIAPRQEAPGAALSALHPALLATLVYRLGAPGRVFSSPGEVQASGQCFLFRRDALERVGGFAAVRRSRCEDVTLARELVAAGLRVGFYELDDLVRARMYEGWREAWQGWPRSLPLRDRFWGWNGRLGLLEVALVQALPLPLLLLLTGRRRRRPRLALAVNAALLGLRLGVLAGTRRAYVRARWTYWLSPLLDLPAAAALYLSLVRRRHLWRGRPMVEDRS
ncbi:glycosyltransferase [Candidatus Nephthysia bennettiae]|uniref:Glycosyltransferase n=1 Tax=Candidatus Nephthysia bennettiae TaxID=3127016 RepID=A0A934N630_9BACT|nr:glycosyltransferase [Candidatus Dormibacteraeota bacterium]MBJ7613158.1 glycosyltransferase [Candidatus Dormibacteraeota bacterium]